MKKIIIVCLVFQVMVSSLIAQALFSDARRFAGKPDPDAVDSIRVFAALLQEKDSLQVWLRMHAMLAYERLYNKAKKNTADAAIWYEAGLRPWRQPGQGKEWKTWAEFQTNVAYFQYNFKRDLIKAGRHYEIARGIYQDSLHINNTFVAKNVLTPMGNVAGRQRDYEKAKRYLSEAREICVKEEAWNEAAYAQNALGMMLLNRGKYREAGLLFKEGLAMSGINMRYKILLLLNYGLSALKDGDLEAAAEATRNAESLLDKHSNALSAAQAKELFATLHDNLGNIFQAKKDKDKAIYHYQQRRRILMEDCGDSACRELAQASLQLADLYSEPDQPDSVLYWIQDALKSMAPSATLSGAYDNPEPNLLVPDHVFYAAFRRKIALLQKDEAALTGIGMLKILVQTCERLFLTDELLRRQYLFEASKLLRQEESHSYFAAGIGAAYKLWAAGKAPVYLEKAWQFAELSRERILLESMRDQERASLAPSNIQDRLQTLQKSRVELLTALFEENLAGNISAVEAGEKALFDVHSEWFRLLDSVTTPALKKATDLPQASLTALRKTMTPDQALISYFVADSTNIYAFVLSASNFHLLKCPPAENVGAIIAGLRQSISNSELRELGDDINLFQKNAGLLYEVLLKQPLALLPPAVKRLCIMADGPLHEIPFELLGKSEQGENFYSYPYLMRRFTVSYASSGKLLVRQSAGAKAQNTGKWQVPFSGFAPQYSDADTIRTPRSHSRTRQIRLGRYDDLPEARKEVSEIAALLRGQAYLSADASEKQFKAIAAGARILHLSMHASLESQDPMFSKLLFSIPLGDETEDGNLNAAEIYNMQLPARLVTLSACETGLGVQRRGEGIMSLARSFAYAGAPTVIMSLWPVEDKATRRLMVDFYRQMNTGIQTDAALQKAKLQYLDACEPSKANPYYWAGFVATGDMSPVSPK